MEIKDLEVWKTAMDLAKNLYELSRLFPETEQNGLSFLMRQSVIGLPANISAAASRKYGKESLQYLLKAKGTIFEIETQVYLAERLGYISGDELTRQIGHIETTRKLLFGFIRHYKRSAEPAS